MRSQVDCFDFLTQLGSAPVCGNVQLNSAATSRSCNGEGGDDRYGFSLMGRRTQALEA